MTIEEINDLLSVVRKTFSIDKIYTTKYTLDLFDLNIPDIQSLIDARSAAYFATGSVGENGKPAMLICCNDCESRSCYSGLTEAYYKKMPLIFVTLKNGFSLSYKTETNDAILCTFDYSGCSKEKITDRFLDSVKSAVDASFPIHVIFDVESSKTKNLYDAKFVFDILENQLVYLFVGKNIQIEGRIDTPHNVSGAQYGVLSTVLGASLNEKIEKCIGICNEDEFLLDINVLGNRHVNNRLSFCVFSNKNIKNIEAYGLACGFSIYYGRKNATKLLLHEKIILIIDDCA